MLVSKHIYFADIIASLVTTVSTQNLVHVECRTGVQVCRFSPLGTLPMSNSRLFRAILNTTSLRAQQCSTISIQPHSRMFSFAILANSRRNVRKNIRSVRLRKTCLPASVRSRGADMIPHLYSCTEL